MTRPPRPRPGFTLVELLVAITIIGILIALLVPVIAGAVRKAREAQVAAEINTLAQSLQSFKTKYGDFPPSRIILMENGFYATSGPNASKRLTDTTLGWHGAVPANPNANQDLTYGALAQRSLRVLRKYFSRATFSTTGSVWPSGSALPNFYDFNGDGIFQDGAPIYLEGHECLVFFLGGIPNSVQSGGTYTFQGMGGFLNNPTNPFLSENTFQSPRSRPLFEFKADRLADEDNDGIPGYLDPLGTQLDGRPYLYFSSYAGAPYDPNDVNSGGPEDLGPPLTGQTFGVDTTPAANPWVSPAANPYTVSPSEQVRPKYVNPESYQIISAGRDRNYGVGGQYDTSSSGDRLPTNSPPVTAGRTADLSSRERDNITNFSNGTLD